MGLCHPDPTGLQGRHLAQGSLSLKGLLAFIGDEERVQNVIPAWGLEPRWRL